MNTKRSQNGSAGGIVFLAVVAGLIWWQWDRIENLFGVAAKGAVAEVKGFSCTPQSNGKSLIEGKVVNLSDAPLAVRAMTAIYDTSGRMFDSAETQVRPTPIPPGQQGEFRTEGPAMPDGGRCHFNALYDAQTGNPVKFKGGR
ncbi:MAG TPA: FxLYD domain-containing protein [Usitatibacter sp.]|nr:FxLYD domain-containing protein [Usitatibacter sp.]